MSKATVPVLLFLAILSHHGTQADINQNGDWTINYLSFPGYMYEESFMEVLEPSQFMAEPGMARGGEIHECAAKCDLYAHCKGFWFNQQHCSQSGECWCVLGGGGPARVNHWNGDAVQIPSWTSESGGIGITQSEAETIYWKKQVCDCTSAAYLTDNLRCLCAACPSFSTSAPQSTSILQCVCVPGYTGPNGGPCVQASSNAQAASNTQCPNLCRAPAGYAVTASGTNIQTCPANHYNSGSAKTCTACPWPQTFTAGTGLTSVAQCACRPGYERLATGVCTACALGSFKNDTGDAACAACAAVLGPHSTTLQPAAANASACVCKPGFALVNGAAGLHCALTTCPPGASLVLTASSAACSCSPGFAHVANLPNGSVVCAACANGFFKDHVADAACTSCGLNTVSAAPRANRTACDCAPDYEPGPLDGPDLPNGFCVPSCLAGWGGSKGNCAKCPPGTFKSAVGKLCQACPGARSASKPGNLLASRCSCPSRTIEVPAADMVVVERLGPFLDDSAESQSATGALLFAADANKHLWRLDIAFPASGAPGARSARVAVAGRLVFACARDACRDTTVELHGARGLLNATATPALTSFTLRWRTRRQVVLAPNAAAAAWLPAAAAQAQAWAAAGRLRPGAAVFRARNVFSTAVSACTPCPAGLRCAAFVP